MERTFETYVGVTQIHPEEMLEPCSSCWPPFQLLLLTCQVLLGFHTWPSSGFSMAQGSKQQDREP